MSSRCSTHHRFPGKRSSRCGYALSQERGLPGRCCFADEECVQSDLVPSTLAILHRYSAVRHSVIPPLPSPRAARRPRSRNSSQRCQASKLLIRSRWWLRRSRRLWIGAGWSVQPFCISDVSHLGVLQKVDFDVETTCNHTAASKDAIHGALKSFSRDDVERMKDILAEARERSKGPSDRVGWLAEETR